MLLLLHSNSPQVQFWPYQPQYKRGGKRRLLLFPSEFVPLKPPESAKSVGTIQSKMKWLVNEIASLKCFQISPCGGPELLPDIIGGLIVSLGFGDVKCLRSCQGRWGQMGKSWCHRRWGEGCALTDPSPVWKKSALPLYWLSFGLDTIYLPKHAHIPVFGFARNKSPGVHMNLRNSGLKKLKKFYLLQNFQNI